MIRASRRYASLHQAKKLAIAQAIFVLAYFDFGDCTRRKFSTHYRELFCCRFDEFVSFVINKYRSSINAPAPSRAWDCLCRSKHLHQIFNYFPFCEGLEQGEGVLSIEEGISLSVGTVYASVEYKRASRSKQRTFEYFQCLVLVQVLHFISRL